MRWATVHFGQTVRTFQQLRSLCSDALAQETYVLERALYASGDDSMDRRKNLLFSPSKRAAADIARVNDDGSPALPHRLTPGHWQVTGN
jgi:hypothetical protein